MRQDDSDIKIMPDKPSAIFDSAEGAANAFLRETHNGNMEKAKVLGGQLAAELSVNRDGANLFGADSDKNMTFQRKVLYCYLVTRVVEDLSPNSMVAQSALAAFQDALQKDEPDIYDYIMNPTVFSQYILAARNVVEDTAAIGRVYAHLCGKADDELLARHGSELTKYFTMYCTELLMRIQMVR